MPNQHTKILNLLDSGNWICSSRFYAEYIADPRSRLAELKKKGYQLEWRWCKTHNYHEGQQKEWRLIGEPPTFNQIVKREVNKFDEKVKEMDKEADYELTILGSTRPWKGFK